MPSSLISYQHEGQAIVIIHLDEKRTITLDIGGANAPPDIDLTKWLEEGGDLLVDGNTIGLGV